MKYSMTAWFAIAAIAGVIYATAAGQVSAGWFDAAMIVIVVLAFFRDGWRARYKQLSGDPGPDLAPPRRTTRDLPSSVRVLRPGDPDETRDIPAVRPDDGKPGRHR